MIVEQMYNAVINGDNPSLYTYCGIRITDIQRNAYGVYTCTLVNNDIVLLTNNMIVDHFVIITVGQLYLYPNKYKEYTYKGRDIFDIQQLDNNTGYIVTYYNPWSKQVAIVSEYDTVKRK